MANKIPDEIGKDFDMDDPIKKTASQRLRGVLFKYWESLGSNGEFEEFYQEKMEVFIAHVKTKLDP